MYKVVDGKGNYWNGIRWVSLKKEEIREGIAEFNYYYPDGKPRIRRKWELLSAEEKKPYIDVALLQVHKLHSQGCVIKVEGELPKRAYYDRFLTGAGQWNKEGKERGYRDAQQDMLDAGCGFFEPLIEKQNVQ